MTVTVPCSMPVGMARGKMRITSAGRASVARSQSECGRPIGEGRGRSRPRATPRLPLARSLSVMNRTSDATVISGVSLTGRAYTGAPAGPSYRPAQPCPRPCPCPVTSPTNMAPPHASSVYARPHAGVHGGAEVDPVRHPRVVHEEASSRRCAALEAGTESVYPVMRAMGAAFGIAEVARAALSQARGTRPRREGGGLAAQAWWRGGAADGDPDDGAVARVPGLRDGVRRVDGALRGGGDGARDRGAARALGAAGAVRSRRSARGGSPSRGRGATPSDR